MPRRFIWMACGLTVASPLFLAVAGPLGRWAELTARILMLLIVGLGMVAFLLAGSRDYSRPKSFQGTQEIQTAPTSPAFNAVLVGQILMLGAFVSFFVAMWQTDAGSFGWLVSAVMVQITVIIIAHIIGVLRGSPRLELTPQALVVRNPLSVVRIPWRALSPTAPVRHVNPKRITLDVTDRKLIERRGFAWRSGEVDLSYVAVNSQFLAESIHSRVVQAQSVQMS